MKKTLIIASFFLSYFLQAQVNIGGSTMSSPSVSLEFGTGNKGIILPWVTSAANVTNSVDGTLIYDTTDHKVKLKSNNVWQDLSKDENGVSNTTIQDNKTEQANSKVVIGTTNENTSGILVLSDTNKAMVLPKVAKPYLNIINPSAGMMVYDTDARQLAVFNGNVWTFWKP
ncbi:hypothetical protein [Chryseobacterium carnipullorum]|uniref:Uncharacterized protein n=1 Tax=Chryseobacterium carnipullorum TaxID=1124835 RepID=A0A376C1J7_CHRCU|nr:hypothetical protein [Chryseobacterium carnipullorum]STA51365.1 Uncharacterised protein [Chryseobacterium carnipullorum]STA51387.1 Uncharacterised protein [Chryseobacterium carnipullorum]